MLKTKFRGLPTVGKDCIEGNFVVGEFCQDECLGI